MFGDIYRGKKVLVTGNTGFKGSWLTTWLLRLGAKVYGLSNGVLTEPSMYRVLDLENRIEKQFWIDIRNKDDVKQAFAEVKPDFVFHLAAQAIVSTSYKDPFDTITTNVVGTASILDAIRDTVDWEMTAVIITSDKAYDNVEWIWGYRENEPLDGFDPYSNSKSCSELVTHSYVRSFFADRDISVSTVRAGNVIGGGDFAKDRIIPDCVRAAINKEVIVLRNPNSTRPYQHVLEPLAVYLMIAARQYEDKSYQGYYNVGPDDCDCINTGDLVDLFVSCWGDDAKWENQAEENAPHEANFLKLDCSKLKSTFGWQPKWHIDECMQMVCQFSKVWLAGGDIPAEMDREIEEFLGVN